MLLGFPAWKYPKYTYWKINVTNEPVRCLSDTTQRQSRMLRLLIAAVRIDSYNGTINTTKFVTLDTHSYAGFVAGRINRRENDAERSLRGYVRATRDAI